MWHMHITWDAWTKRTRNCYSFCRTMLCISAAYAVMQCLSVCVSVRPSRLWIMSKGININVQKFSLSGSRTILVFPYQTSWHYSDGNPSKGGVECKGDMKQEAQLSLTDHAMLVCKVVEVWQDVLSEYVDKKFTYIWRLIRHEWIYYGSKNCVIYNSYKIV